MSADPITRLPRAVGSVFKRIRQRRTWSVGELATASDMSSVEIRYIEAGKYTPNLQEFFHLAVCLGESPVILLTEVIAEWRADPADHGLYRSRPSDLARLYRLGCFHDPGDFREIPRVYDQMDQATGAVRSLNVSRRAKSLPPLDTICIYVRVGSVAFQPDEEGES